MKKEQSKINFSSGMDKMDGHLPQKDNFLHDSYYVGSRTSRFHKTTAYGYRETGPGFNLGIQQKLYRASGEGFMVDGYNSSSIGKSDE